MEMYCPNGLIYSGRFDRSILSNREYEMRGELIYVKHPQDEYARQGGLHHTYFDIAEDEYVKCLDLEKIDTSHMYPNEEMEISMMVDKHKIKAIIFAALCVEAAINDYAGIHFGDTYSKKHLQNLDVISKWVVLPKLACGKSIDKSGPTFNALTQLIKSRNNLVHNKSKEITRENPISPDTLFKAETSFNSDFENSLKALYLLSMEMDFLLGQRHNPIKTLDKKFSIMLEIPKQTELLFNECKKTILNLYPSKTI